MSDGRTARLTTPTSSHVTIVGAGIVGVCCARWLQRDGHQVTLIDRGAPGSGSSFGNAGGISTVDASVPMPSTRLLRSVPGMLLDSKRGLTIRWRYLPKLLPWLRHLVAASPAHRRLAGARAFHTLLTGTPEAYDRLLAGSEAHTLILRSGLLNAYDTEETFAAAAPERQMLTDLGVHFEVLEAHEVRQLEPAVERVQCAVHFPQPYRVVDPFRFTQLIAADVEANGGSILNETVKDIVVASGRAREVRTDRASHPVDRLLIAAGAWSRAVTRMMGIDAMLDTECGYHVQINGLQTGLRRGLLHRDFEMGINQMSDGLRIAGTVEFAGLDAPPDFRRTESMLKHTLSVMRGIDRVDEAKISRWMGFRPTMPDYLPVIGPAPGVSNGWLAFGHQHLGLSLGSRTGEIIAHLVGGRDPGLDLTPFRVDRF